MFDFDEGYGPDPVLDDLWGGSEDEGHVVAYLFGSCLCGWQGSGMYWAGDQGDRKKAEAKMKKDHGDHFPKCSHQPSIY